MDQQEPNPDPQQALSNSIDELMDELDGSHAPDVQASDQGADAEPAQDTSTDETLEALEAVTENTEALIDDAIGDLLNEPSPVSLDESVAEPSKATEPATDSAPSNVIAELPEDVLDQIAEEESAAANAAEASAIEPPIAEDAATDDVLDAVNEDLIGAIDLIAEQSIDPTSEAQSETISVSEFESAVESAIESVIEEPAEPAEPAAAEPIESEEQTTEPEPESDLGLGDLDDVLAGIGDDLLMGDFATPEGELVETNTNEDDQAHSLLLESLALDVTPIKEVTPIESVESIEASEAAAETETIANTAPADETQGSAIETPQEATHASEPIAEAEPEQTPGPEPDPTETTQASATVPATIPADTPATPEPIAKAPTHSPDTSSSQHAEQDEDEIRSIWQTAFLIGQAKSKQIGHLIVTRGGPMLAKGVLQLSRPLASKSPEIRNSVGYVAIWTLFLAAILWGYTMFFRTPPTPTPTKAPTRVVTSGDDLEAIENQMPSESP